MVPIPTTATSAPTRVSAPAHGSARTRNTAEKTIGVPSASRRPSRSPRRAFDPKAFEWLLLIVAGKVLLSDTMTLAPKPRIIATGVLYTMLVIRLERQRVASEEPVAEAFDV